MAKSVLELAVGTGQWDAGLKKAKSALDNFTQANGGLQSTLEKESQKMQQFVRMMGQMDSTAKTAKGQMNDYKSTIEQLTMQYNRMTDAQKKAVGQDYLQAIDQMKQKYQAVNNEIQEMNRSLSGVSSPAGGGGGGLFSGDKISGMLQVFGGNIMTKAAGMAAGFATELGDAVKQGVELAKQGEGIRIAFERLGRGDILQGLREATHGTVTDLELMKAAVKFNDFRLPVEELGTMLAFAQQKAKDTGQSVDYMVDSIVTGLGRKSLMILDNLGLSAAEIKEKMAETGDMTKAVGAIIREQMAKAGDYVETAADRAAQANVSLQNKMEELGLKFAPLEEASNNFWTSMKIGILNVVGGPLTTLLNKLTQAGRMANAYGLMGGNTKVGRMTANLAGASEGNRQSIYQQQQEQIWRYINRRENALKERDRWFKDMGNKELGEHLSREYQAFGTADRGEIQAQIDAAKKLLREYQAYAKQILQPIKQDGSSSTLTSPSGGAGKGGKAEIEAAIGSIDYQTKKVQELQKAWRAAADDDSRRKIKAEIEEQQYILDRMTGKEKFDPTKMQPITDLSGRTPWATSELLTKGTETLTLPVKLEIQSPTEKLKEEIQRLKEEMDDLWSTDEVVVYKERIAELENQLAVYQGNIVSGGKNANEAWKNTASVVNAVGSALNNIQDPSAKIAAIVAQGIASLVAAYGDALAKDESSKFNIYQFLGTSLAATAQMIAQISQIHSATGYAEGGVVKGNTYSCDQIPAMLNAGEVVLNRSQTANLANELQGEGRSLRVTGYLRGEDIALVADRWGRRTGKGELAFWK